MLKSFLDATDAKLLWFLVSKINFPIGGFHFDEELNEIIFDSENQLDEKELIKNLPEIMEVTITKLAREKNVPLT